MGANLNVMCNLAQVIYSDIFFQHSIAHSAPVDTGIRANFAIVTDRYRTQLRYFFPMVSCKSDPKAVRTNDNTRMDCYPFAESDAMPDADIGIEATALLKPALCFQNSAGPDGATCVDKTLVSDYYMGPDKDIFTDSGRVGNHGRGVNAGLHDWSRIEQYGQPRISKIRVFCYKVAGRAVRGIFLFQDDSTGLCLRQVLVIGRVREKADLCWARGGKRAYTVNHEVGVAVQSQTEARAQIRQAMLAVGW